jgi:hypothetical protein
MISKKYKSRNTRRFVPPPLPQSLSKNLDVEIRHIVQRFQSVTAKMPANQIGAASNSIRAEFVAQQVERWIADDLRCMARASVQSLVNDGYSETAIFIPPGQNVPVALTEVVTDGLEWGLNNLLKKVEESTLDVSDDLLRSFGLTDDGIEVFRRLLPSYSGTLDELLEAAAVL